MVDLGGCVGQLWQIELQPKNLGGSTSRGYGHDLHYPPMGYTGSLRRHHLIAQQSGLRGHDVVNFAMLK